MDRQPCVEKIVAIMMEDACTLSCQVYHEIFAEMEQHAAINIMQRIFMHSILCKIFRKHI